MEQAFTTRLPLAVMIVLGVKEWENRSCCPVPANGHCGMSVSRASDESEYANFLAFVEANASPRLKAAIPTWEQVKDWRGKMVAEMDYETFDGERGGHGVTALPSLDGVIGASAAPWDEGYRYWWKLSNVKMLERPVTVRGNVGMWRIGA